MDGNNFFMLKSKIEIENLTVRVARLSSLAIAINFGS